MLLVPYVSFLIAESLNLSGYLVLINSAFLLSLYGIPNMEQERAESLSNILQTMSYTFRSIAYVFMGISLPLQHNQAQMPESELEQITQKIYMGVFLSIMSGFIASLITAFFCIRSNFDGDDKRIHVV